MKLIYILLILWRVGSSMSIFPLFLKKVRNHIIKKELVPVPEKVEIWGTIYGYVIMECGEEKYKEMINLMSSVF